MRIFITAVAFLVSVSALGQEIVTKHGTVSVNDLGIILDKGAEQIQLSFNPKDHSPAYICGYDEWLFFLRNTKYVIEINGFQITAKKLYKINLINGAEEEVLFSNVIELEREVSSILHLNDEFGVLYQDAHELEKNIFPIVDLSFCEDDEKYDCIYDRKVQAIAGEYLLAGCTYPYLFIITKNGRDLDEYSTFRYDVINNTYKCISYIYEPRLIHKGLSKNYLLGTHCFHGDHTLEWQDVIVDYEGTIISEIGTSWELQYYREKPVFGSPNIKQREHIENISYATFQTCKGCVDLKNNHQASKPFHKTEITFEKSDSTFSINSVAVIPKEIKACDGSITPADELAFYTENNILSHYNVTDRRHLEEILNEHRLQMSGLTSERLLIENGCIENAQAYLFVQSGCLMGEEMIEIRLVHCESSSLVWSCTGLNATPQEVLARINEELLKE